MAGSPPGAEAAPTPPSGWAFGWTCVLVPNAAMMFMHYRGGTLFVVNTVLRTAGVGGLFVVPFIGLAMEKCFYDTALACQGLDPTAISAERKGEGFPSGGHALPSLALLPVHRLTVGDLLPSAWVTPQGATQLGPPR
ncbi:hypothetical protein T492DRAFT_940758 [Pavlovales sp. CCMP2436]|nr:hypothetical protein T492DRAFT_940758 [Pavlovales sp. CCMP2436]